MELEKWAPEDELSLEAANMLKIFLGGFYGPVLYKVGPKTSEKVGAHNSIYTGYNPSIPPKLSTIYRGPMSLHL